MKDWILHWLGIGKPSKKDFEDLATATVETLAKAKDAHIADLRILIDKGHEREEQLSRMVEMALQHQFYRPTVTGKASENRSAPAIPVDSLTDVAVFDEADDAALSKRQEDELQALIKEQNEQGVNKVTA